MAISSMTHFTNLMALATCLRQAEDNGLHFDMDCYIDDDSGLPSCALGHYFARRDLQQDFNLAELKDEKGESLSELPLLLKWRLYRHFGLDFEEQDDFFSGYGCDDALSPAEAAEYIERTAAVWYPLLSVRHRIMNRAA